MSKLNEIRERVEESKRLNGVFGPQAQDDLEYLLGLLDRCRDLLEEVNSPDLGIVQRAVKSLLRELEES